MPKLPTAEALGERPSPQPGTGAASYRPQPEGIEGQALAGVGKGLQWAGNEIYRAAKIEEERLNTQAAEDAFSRYRDEQLDLTVGEQHGFKHRKGADAVMKPTVKDYTTRLDDIRKGIESGLSNDRQRQIFQQRARVATIQFREGLAHHVSQETETYSKQVFASTKASELSQIAANYDQPFLAAFSVDRVNDAIDNEAERLGAPADAAALEKRTFLDLAWKTRLDAWRLKDPAAALAAFHQNADQISPTVRQQLAESLFVDAAPVLAAQLVQQEGTFRAVVANDAEGAGVSRLLGAMGKDFVVEEGGAKKTVFDMLPGDQKLRVLALAQTQMAQGQAVERRRVVGLLQDAEAAAADGKIMQIPDSAFVALGTDGDAARDSYRNSQQMASDIALVRTLPVAERARLLEQRLPAEGGPGYAEAAKRNDIRARAVAEVNRQQAADPAAFTTVVSPAAGAAYAALTQAMGGQDPAARRQAAQVWATATAAEQERLGGFPRRSGQRLAPEVQILPKPLADQIARQFMTPAEGGQGPAQLIQAQADMWGAYWPQVYQQIAKDIGPTARVVSNLRDTPAAALLSMNSTLKTPDLRKPLLAADAKTVDETLDLELDAFRRSLVGWTTGGSQAFNDYDEAARRNAYVYAAQGVKPGDAAKRAARELVGDYYEIRGSVRIPKTVDARGAETGMDAVLRDAEKLPIASYADRALGQEFTDKQVAASVKANGFFVTLGDDSGVALYLKGANGDRAVEGKDGRPITFTWRQLLDRKAAEDAASKKQRPVFDETPGGAATMRGPR